MMAARVARSTADPPAASPARANTSTIGGSPCTAPRTRPAEVASRPTCERSSSRRRSTRSASAPPARPKAMKGASAKRDDQADHAGRGGERGDLEGEGEEGHLAAEARHEAAEHEDAVVPRVPQCARVDGDGADE